MTKGMEREAAFYDHILIAYVTWPEGPDTPSSNRSFIHFLHEDNVQDESST